MSSPCLALVTDQQNTGRLISHSDAKPLLENYLIRTGIKQPDRTDPNHIFGHLFGLNVLKEMFRRIDKHNTDTTDFNEQITAVRIYQAQSGRGGSALKSDLLLVPVRRSGEDYPQSLMLEADTDMIVCDSGPCPNVCGQLYFYTK